MANDGPIIALTVRTLLVADFKGTEMAYPELRSIYRSRFERPFNDDDVTQPVTRGGSRKPARLPPVTQDSSLDWSLLRKGKPVNYMLPMSIEWLRSLPEDVRPMALVTQYPRIANSLALEWNRPAACRAYFVDLFVDHRGTRKGFPADVHRDLKTLRDHYYGQHLTLVE
jgi:hypothetical protein